MGSQALTKQFINIESNLVATLIVVFLHILFRDLVWVVVSTQNLKNKCQIQWAVNIQTAVEITTFAQTHLGQ